MNAILFTLEELQDKLQRRTVTQTIRSKTQLSKNKWRVGAEVPVKWRDQLVGQVQIVLIEAWNIRKLTDDDARLTGFDSRDDLIKALKRFFGRLGEKRFWENEVYRVKFKWL